MNAIGNERCLPKEEQLGFENIFEASEKILLTSLWMRSFCLEISVTRMFVKIVCRFLDLSHLPPMSQCSATGTCQNPGGQ